MRVVDATDFEGQSAWDALDIALIDGISIRLHWTDRPYHWHVNDGQEVFAVLDGVVDMQVRSSDGIDIHRLVQGSIFHAEEGDAHCALPRGAARILVIERAGSV